MDKIKPLVFIAKNTRTGTIEKIRDLYWFEENMVHENGDEDWIIEIDDGAPEEE